VAKLRVLLIEDNRLLRTGITAILNEQKDIRAVATAGNTGALEKAAELAPHVVLLDLGLKSSNSLKVLEAIKKRCPKAEVIVMDLIPTNTATVDLLKAGVSGFVSRDATLEDFLSTIRSVTKGIKVLPATTADSLFSKVVEQAIQAGTVDRVMATLKLTKREQDVMGLLAAGSTVAQIARRHKVAAFTVKAHVRNIVEKLALHTRLELAAFPRS
jgi:DNA-binding NarL/FixJ family response regulator